MRRISSPAVFCGCLVLALGCAGNTSSSDPGTAGSNGTAGTTGTAGSGTTGSGGSTSTAGTSGTGNTGPGAAGNSGSGGSSSGTAGTTGTAGSVSTAGSTGSGGRGGATGTAGRGGNTGTAGTVGTAGAMGSAGNTGAGGSTSGCTITATSSLSTKIATVGIVTFTTTQTSPTSAKIDFGLDTSYGMTAPVDLTQANYRTLLLGMKASKMYHYRITTTNSSGSCQGGDQTIMTGPLPNGGLPQLTVTTMNKAALYGGFLVVGSYQGSTYQAFILDVDGDFVWWYSDGADGCGTHMSWDGQYMWMNNGNVPDSAAKVHRITMDGMTDTDFSTALGHLSHQITMLPDGSIAFYATGSNGCDDIKVFPANGTPTSTAKTLVNSRTAHGGTGACHVNYIAYQQSDDSLVFSDLDNVCLTKVSRTTGSTIWVMGGTNGVTSTFTGDLWAGGEHGIHFISDTDLLLFNNNSPNNSQALELTVDATGKKVTKKWSYTPTSPLKVMVLGDVQRMTGNGPNGAGNGNTIIDFGTGDTIHEVDSSGKLLQEIKSKYPYGFMEKRPTLYGPPTK